VQCVKQCTACSAMMYVAVDVDIYTYIYICMYLYIYVYISICIYIYVAVDVAAYWAGGGVRHIDIRLCNSAVCVDILTLSRL